MLLNETFKISDFIEKGDTRLKDVVGRNAYARALWVYVCITKIAQTCASIPIEFYKGNTLLTSEDTNDPVVNLFFPPYATIIPTMEFLIEATLVNWLLDGDVFWVPDINTEVQNDGTKKESVIKIIPGASMTENMGKNGNAFSGWIFNSAGKDKKKNHVPLKADEVVQFKFTNPYNMLRGMAPLTALRFSIELDYYADSWNASFFKAGDVPSCIIESEKPLNTKQKRELRAEWRKYRDGIEKRSGLLILDNGAKIGKRGLDIEDFKFLDAKKLSREQTCAGYGVQPAIVGIHDYSNYANAIAQDAMFYKAPVVPLHKVIVSTINSQILDKNFSGQGYKAKADYSNLPHEIAMLLEKAQAVQRFTIAGVPFRAINNRFSLGFPKMKGDELGYLQGVPVMEYTEENDTVEKITDVDPVIGRRGLKGGCPPHLTHIHIQKRKQVIWNKNAVTTARETVMREIYEPWEKRLTKIYKNFVDAMGKEVAEEIKGMTNAQLESYEFDSELWGDEYKELMTPHAMKIALQAIYLVDKEQSSGKLMKRFKELLSKAIPQDIVLEDFLTEVQIAALENAIAETLEFATLSITQTYSNSINEVVLDGIREGDSATTIANRILEATKYQSNNALTNARTLTASAYNTARVEGFKAYGVKYGTWLTMGDEFVRPDHADEELLGTIVEIGKDVFPVTNLPYPGAPGGAPEQVINCRCTLLPV